MVVAAAGWKAEIHPELAAIKHFNSELYKCSHFRLKRYEKGTFCEGADQSQMHADSTLDCTVACVGKKKCRKLAFRWFKATWSCHGVNLHTSLVILHSCLQDCVSVRCLVSHFAHHLCVDNRLSLAQLVWVSLACQLCSYSFIFGWPSSKLAVQEVRVECFIIPTSFPLTVFLCCSRPGTDGAVPGTTV